MCTIHSYVMIIYGIHGLIDLSYAMTYYVIRRVVSKTHPKVGMGVVLRGPRLNRGLNRTLLIAISCCTFELAENPKR